jgi:hypothetical protein
MILMRVIRSSIMTRVTQTPRNLPFLRSYSVIRKERLTSPDRCESDSHRYLADDLNLDLRPVINC